MNYHRDFNTIFTFDWIKDYQWFGAGRVLTYYFINETVVNRNVDINKFSADYYIKSKKGNGYTVGTVEERQALGKQKRGFLMPIVQKVKGITIKKNELFYTCKKYLKGRRTFLNDCEYVKTVTVNENAFKVLNSLYSNFTLKFHDFWKVRTDKDFYWKDDDLLTPNSHFLNYRDFQFNFSDFSYKKDQNYNPWLWSNNSIHSASTKKILPGTLKDAENLFDKNVIPINNLVREIRDIKRNNS